MLSHLPLGTRDLQTADRFYDAAREAVDVFHVAALEAGGCCDGEPGLREHYGPTYHPAFLLRSPHFKKDCWQDVQLAMGELGLRPPTRA